MSYELALYRTSGAPLTFQEVRAVVIGIGHMTESDDMGFLFQPPGTESCLRLGMEPEGYLEHELWDAGAEHVGSVMSCRIPIGYLPDMEPYYPRILMYIARRLDLWIYDKQRDEEVYPCLWSDDRWEARNRADWLLGQMDSVRESIDGLAREKREYVDRFERLRDYIEGKWAPVEMYIPEISFVRPAGGGEIMTAVAWPFCAPIILPEVDLVAVRVGKEGLLGLLSRQHQGVISMRELKERLGEEIQRVDQHVSHWICRCEKHRSIKDILERANLMPFSGYRLISREDEPDA